MFAAHVQRRGAVITFDVHRPFVVRGRRLHDVRIQVEEDVVRVSDEIERGVRTPSQYAHGLFEREYRPKLIEISRVNRASDAQDERNEQQERLVDVDALCAKYALVQHRHAAVVVFARSHDVHRERRTERFIISDEFFERSTHDARFEPTSRRYSPLGRLFAHSVNGKRRSRVVREPSQDVLLRVASSLRESIFRNS